MAVKTKLQPDYDADAIVALAGAVPDDAWVQDGWLYIEGVTQGGINQAKAAYISDHATNHLARQKRISNDEIDKVAEDARGRLLRTTPGQSIVEFKKENDAERYITDGYPANLNPYHWIKAEVEITGFTGQVIADGIIAQRDADLVTDSLIEKERKKAKIEVDQQLGPIGVHVARDNLKAVLDAVNSTTDVSNLPRSIMPPPVREVLPPSKVLDRALLKSVEILTPHALIPSIAEPEEVRAYEPPALTLEEVIDEGLYTVDALAEHTRQEYMGVGPAQMMVYTEKFNEASDYLVDDMPSDTTPYPFIDAETGSTGKSAEQVANDIIDEKGKWIAFNAKVERVRLVAKTHLREAQTVESADNIVKLAAETLDSMVE